MGDPSRCGCCGFFFCDCGHPVERDDGSILCARCGGCMDACAGEEEYDENGFPVAFSEGGST